MKPNIQNFISISVIFFLLGMSTTHYKTFPYKQLQSIKNIIFPPPILHTPKYSDYYHDKTAFFEQHKQPHYDIVFVGDSLTDNAEWHDLFPNLTIANRGISGDTTEGIIKRLNHLKATSTDHFFIMVGINDFTRGKEVEEVFSNYQNILHTLISNKKPIFIQSTLSGAEEKYTQENIRVKKLNEKLQIFAAKHSSLITYIDLDSSLSDHTGLKSIYTRDGQHLNHMGYDKWKNIITPYIYSSASNLGDD